jgi:YD repeat-containing protein
LSRYIYDDNGRLRAVISPNAEAAIYEYDPAGNITAIRRNTANTLEVLDFSPFEGVPGTQVTIVGTGFGGGVTGVTFNGTTAQIISVLAPVITVTVPGGATTGPIGVTTPGGSTSTAKPFMVKGISVTPPTAAVFTEQTVQFNASVVLTGNQSVVWSIDGIGGGSAVVGTISATGLYTAPKLPVNQPNAVFHVEARSVSDASVYGEALLTVKNTEFFRPVFTSAISVRNGSVPPMNATPSFSAPVSVTNAPAITMLTPLQLPRGANTNITITGANLSGATAFSFINIAAAALDTNITASNISVNGAGTSLTATLTVSAGADTGRRVVVVTAGGRMSPSTDIGDNTIEVIP